eukprot:6179835-Pleurochrysis_carterae.AAC.2
MKSRRGSCAKAWPAIRRLNVCTSSRNGIYHKQTVISTHHRIACSRQRFQELIVRVGYRLEGCRQGSYGRMRVGAFRTKAWPAFMSRAIAHGREERRGVLGSAGRTFSTCTRLKLHRKLALKALPLYSLKCCRSLEETLDFGKGGDVPPR